MQAVFFGLHLIHNFLSRRAGLCKASASTQRWRTRFSSVQWDEGTNWILTGEYCSFLFSLVVGGRPLRETHLCIERTCKIHTENQSINCMLFILLFIQKQCQYVVKQCTENIEFIFREFANRAEREMLFNGGQNRGKQDPCWEHFLAQ